MKLSESKPFIYLIVVDCRHAEALNHTECQQNSLYNNHPFGKNTKTNKKQKQ